MAERLQPFKLAPPDGFCGKIIFQLRILLDFQIRTIYYDLKGFLPQVKGKILDVGCGMGPYKHLLDPLTTEYTGLDTARASNFGYSEAKVLVFDGSHIPFPDGSADCVLCTEVLEHVPNPKQLIDETYRVLKAGGRAVITVPWSARMHYFPYDYYRYSSYILQDMFREFSCSIVPRGTDITVIVSKIMIVYLRNFQLSNNVPLSLLRLILIPVFLPWILWVVLVGHLSLLLRWGSPDDPLGWTVYLQKKGAA